MKITFTETITQPRREETMSITTAHQIWKEMQKLPCEYVANIDIYIIEKWIKLNLPADEHSILERPPPLQYHPQTKENSQIVGHITWIKEGEKV